MINNITNYKLEHFFDKGFVKDTIQMSIIKHHDGSYELFDKFIVFPKDKEYYVETKNIFGSTSFYSLQNAVTWCIFQNKGKFLEANRIESLDKVIQSIDFSISLLKNRIHNESDTEAKLIYSAKLSQDKFKRINALSELSGYKNQAKRWQLDKFNTKKV